MIWTRKTLALLAAVAFLAVLNLLPGSSARRQSLPTLPALEPARLTRVELARAGQDAIILGRSEGDAAWQVEGPYQAMADAEAVDLLLSTFQKPLVLDARLDEGNLESYGVD